MTSNTSTFTGTAAVVRSSGGPFETEDVSFDEPRSDEIIVRIVASGMCHTDLMVRDDRPEVLPAILGHEGAGVVEAVGAGITDLAPGDQVLMSYPSCGLCRHCNAGRWAYCDHISALKFACSRLDGSTSAQDSAGNGLHNHFFGQSSFGSLAVTNRRNVVKVDVGDQLAMLAPLGCGVQTGAGAIINSLAVPAGASVAVFGAGAVGLSAIMAAKLVGATTIVAVDTVDSRLELARELGATHTHNAQQGGSVEAVREVSAGRGVEYALEATGHPAVFTDAVHSLGQLGTLGFVGAAPRGALGELNLLESMMSGRRIMGVLQGDSVPPVFIPRLIDLYQRGLLPIDRLITTYPFADINTAAHHCETGQTIKPVLVR